MKAAGRIWLEMEDGTKLGHGKIELLALAGELGSLRKAAERMQISYRQAWYKINQMNKCLIKWFWCFPEVGKTEEKLNSPTSEKS